MRRPWFRRLAVSVVGALTMAGCGSGGGQPSVGTASPPPSAAALATTGRPTDGPPSASATGRALPTSGLVAFVVESGPNGDDVKNLWTIQPDGQNALELTHTADEAFGYPAFTADGQRLLADHSYPEQPSTIVSMDLGGRDLRVEVEARASVGQPAISADGQWLAWSETDGGRASIFVSRIDGTDRRLVVDPGDNPDYPDMGARFPAFSPDGLSLAVTIDEAVHVVRLDGSDDRILTVAGRNCAQGRWSHDGLRIITSCDGRLQLLSVDGSARPVDLVSGNEPAFSPDDAWIVFQRWLPGTAHIGLVIARPDGSQPTEIWKTPEGENVFLVEPAWAP